jgi:DnaJ-class molecular chaperone
MQMNESFYDVLGIAKDATPDEIKLAWRTTAKATHPDLYPGDAEKQKRFLAAREAYDVLSDYDKRRFYDFELKAKGAMTCPECSKPKMPTHSICVWCALGRAAKETARKKTKGQPDDIPPDMGEAGNRTPRDHQDEPRAWRFKGINPDDLLEQVLSEGAFRAARGIHPDIRFGIHIGPELKVDIHGETVELLKDVHRNLTTAQKMASRVRSWFKT